MSLLANDRRLKFSNTFCISYLFCVIFLFIVFFIVFLYNVLANSAATGAGIIWFVTYSPFFFLQLRYANLTRADKLISCLFSNTAMAFASQLMSMFEGSSKFKKFSCSLLTECTHYSKNSLVKVKESTGTT